MIAFSGVTTIAGAENGCTSVPLHSKQARGDVLKSAVVTALQPRHDTGQAVNLSWLALPPPTNTFFSWPQVRHWNLADVPNELTLSR